MSCIILLNKPFNMLSQFTGEPGQRTLAELGLPGEVYAAGRLDADSEGLLLLTDDGRLQSHLADPRHKQPKVYFVQVEGAPDEAAVQALRAGVLLKDGPTQPCEAAIVDAPDWLWPRNPPVRFRKTVPDHWLRIVLREGRNRQVRRMTASVGLPTLRLVRWSSGEFELGSLLPGQWFLR
jgi:23S rRNA pseudouridine2457 synthase